MSPAWRKFTDFESAGVLATQSPWKNNGSMQFGGGGEERY